jgi:hypothetical protein
MLLWSQVRDPWTRNKIGKKTSSQAFAREAEGKSEWVQLVWG